MEVANKWGKKAVEQKQQQDKTKVDNKEWNKIKCRNVEPANTKRKATK